MDRIVLFKKVLSYSIKKAVCGDTYRLDMNLRKNYLTMSQNRFAVFRCLVFSFVAASFSLFAIRFRHLVDHAVDAAPAKIGLNAVFLRFVLRCVTLSALLFTVRLRHLGYNAVDAAPA